MGEESFVARLPEPHRGQATDLMRKHARAVDLFVAPAQAYADEMSEFLAVSRERIRVVRTGVDTALFAPAVERTRDPFRIGFLSRLSRAKGIDLLCEAFRIVARRGGGRVVLSVAGQMLGPNKRLWKGLMKGLAADGLANRVEQIGAPDLAGKVAFLGSLSVFCVPTDDAEVLAAAICELHDDPGRADKMGRNAAEGVAAHFSADRMVDQTLSAYEACISARRQDGPGSR
jgi:glycosyltransferase involved in cell wall biosynthesis